MENAIVVYNDNNVNYLIGNLSNLGNRIYTFSYSIINTKAAFIDFKKICVLGITKNKSVWHGHIGPFSHLVFNLKRFNKDLLEKKGVVIERDWDFLVKLQQKLSQDKILIFNSTDLVDYIKVNSNPEVYYKDFLNCF